MEKPTFKLYSRTGVQSIQRNAILKHKEQIISGRVLSKKPQIIRKKKEKSNAEQIAKKFQEVDYKRKAYQERIKPVKPDFFFKAQGRDEIQQALSNQDRFPTCWSYTPDPAVIKPKTPSYSVQQKRQFAVGQDIKLIYSTDLDIKYPDRWNHIPIPEFSTQTDRKPLSANQSLNEKRFLPLKKPDNLEKHISVPQFNKAVPRQELFIVTNQDTLSYNPQFQLTDKKISLNIPNFKNQIGRRWSSQMQDKSKRDVFYDFEKNQKKIQLVPNLKKEVGRTLDKMPLPCFMKNISTRLGVQYLNKKSLELNNYSQGQFQTIRSSFMELPSSSTTAIISPNSRPPSASATGTYRDFNLKRYSSRPATAKNNMGLVDEVVKWNIYDL